MTAFVLPDEFVELRESVRRLADEHIAPNAAEADEREEYPWASWNAWRDAGFAGLAFPEAYGGQGGGILAHAIAVEEVARVLRVVVAVHVHLEAGHDAGARPRIRGAQAEVRRRGSRRASARRRTASPKPTPAATSRGMRTRAVRDGDHYVLTGRSSGSPTRASATSTPCSPRPIPTPVIAASSAAQRQAQELALLDQVRTALTRDLNLPTVIRTVVEAIAQTFGYTHVSLYLLQEDRLVLQHQVGYAREIKEIALSQGVAGRVGRTGEPVLLKDVRTAPDFLGAVAGISSEICVPLVDEGQVVGILNVESTAGVTLAEADLRLISVLAEHINIAIGRARLYTAVRQSEERVSRPIGPDPGRGGDPRPGADRGGQPEPGADVRL